MYNDKFFVNECYFTEKLTIINIKKGIAYFNAPWNFVRYLFFTWLIEITWTLPRCEVYLTIMTYLYQGRNQANKCNIVALINWVFLFIYWKTRNRRVLAIGLFIQDYLPVSLSLIIIHNFSFHSTIIYSTAYAIWFERFLNNKGFFFFFPFN